TLFFKCNLNAITRSFGEMSDRIQDLLGVRIPQSKRKMEKNLQKYSEKLKDALSVNIEVTLDWAFETNFFAQNDPELYQQFLHTIDNGHVNYVIGDIISMSRDEII